MKQGIGNLNSVPLRRDPDSKSEMVSQIIFGETFEIVDSNDKWIRIILDFDFYEGWVKKNQILFLTQKEYDEIVMDNTSISKELVTYITSDDNDLQTLTIGASLPKFNGTHFKLVNKRFFFEGQTNRELLPKQSLVHTAYLFLNAPFLWGGRTPFGVDCSGFIQMVYKINGHSILRDASLQASQGEVLSFIEESEPGDLAFFDNHEGDIIHVGMILADNHIIHCHGKVRIDRLDQSGIYNVDTKRHTHNLRVMKRIF